MDVNDELTTAGVLDNSTVTESLPYESSDYTQRVIVATMFLIIFVVGITGNSLVILAVLLSKKLRTTTNAFVVNLSVADLLTCLALPIDAVALLSTNISLPLVSVCGVAHVVFATTVGCSIYTLAAVSLNRLLLITRQVTTYRAIYTPKKTAVWLVLAWLVPFIVVLMPPLLGIGAVGFSPDYHLCKSSTTHPSQGVYSKIKVMTLYPVPLVIIVTCYALIWRHLKRHAKRMVTTAETPVNSTSTETKPKATLNRQSRKQAKHRTSTVSRPRMSRHQNEITKNMFFIICAFIMCLTPPAISMLFMKSIPATQYATAILSSNSCINPFIYATKHPHFKTVLGCIIRRQWDRIPKPSGLLKAVSKCGN